MAATAEAPQGDAQARRTERLVLLVLAAVQFISIVDFMVVMPLGPQLMRSLEIGPAEFGLIVSSYTFAAGLAGLVASSVIDRFGRRASFLTLYAGFLLGTFFCGIAPDYLWLIGARLLTGAFGGVLGGMAMAVIGDVFPEERRGRATASLMSAFALASVAGVPFGLYLGTAHGWRLPFRALVALGLPVLVIGGFVLPALRGHIGQKQTHPLRSLAETFGEPNHWNAFFLMISLMIGGFAVIPYISPYLVANVGMPESELPWVYVAGGCLTLIAAPAIGKLSDRHGKLVVYRVIAPLSAALMLTVSLLPPVATFIAVAAVSALMVSNAGRMIAAMAMITGSVRPERRGGFMSANSSVQHIATGIGAYCGGLIIQQSPDGKLHHFGIVGLIGASTTLASLWLAGRLRMVDETRTTNTADSLVAAAEASCDVGEPLVDLPK